ncbi:MULTISPECIES: TetR/AcrR family transcriptional regulator [Lactobacillaceae]|uniref:TetR/AcrR family transcriptional regulator n=1 Tax=Lactobacillaceae TaxID=33958 RepID=UPI0014571F6B|nr:TetR/AcrR family transcriptional regulator [Lactobacillus sp. HBUAS51381]NLR10586.1 TetR/AcrR family transcriptional regulator [Lactobacillus sp. HBUAS51381]
MRKIDEAKINKITLAVITLVKQQGLTNLTTAKVAKMAGVSPATLYIYYQDKTDMLSRIYELVKDDLHAGLLATLHATPVVLDQQLRAMLRYAVAQYRVHPQEAQFVQVLWNNPEALDEAARHHGTELDTALGQLFSAIVADNQYMDLSREAFEIIFSAPTQLLIRQPDVDTAEIEQMISVVIKAVHR